MQRLFQASAIFRCADADADAKAKTIIYEIYNIYNPANVQKQRAGVQNVSDESFTANSYTLIRIHVLCYYCTCHQWPLSLFSDSFR